MTVDRFTLAQLGGSLRWLIDLHWGGEIVRLSTEEFDVAEATAGQTWHYHGRLSEVAITERAPLLEEGDEGFSLPLEVAFPFDAAARDAQGHYLEGCKVEISQWPVGSDYSTRRLIVVGQVADPEIRGPGEASSFTIEVRAWKDRALIPPTGWRVDGTAWGTSEILSLATAELGLFYPLIYGYPGLTSKSSRGWISGSQGVWVHHERTFIAGPGHYDNLKLVLAGHPVQATRVMLLTDDDPSGERFVVQHMQDARGTTVAYVDAKDGGTSGGAGDWFEVDADAVTAYGLGESGIDNSFQPEDYSVQPQDGFKPVFAAWYAPSASGHVSGGKRGQNGNVIREAGDVWADVMSYSTIPVDHGETKAQLPFLSHFLIDCMIDAQMRPSEWVQSNLNPILPIAIRVGPRGLYPLVWRLEATASESVCHLDANTDPYIRRVSGIKIDGGEIYNDITVRFGYSVRNGNHLYYVRAHGGAFKSNQPDDYPDAFCRLSQQRYKSLDGLPFVSEREISTVCVYDPGTASSIVAWMARAYALRRRTIEILARRRDFGWLKPGAVVLYTDSSVSLSRQVALVQELQQDGSGVMALRLMLLEDPARDARA